MARGPFFSLSSPHTVSDRCNRLLRTLLRRLTFKSNLPVVPAAIGRGEPTQSMQSEIYFSARFMRGGAAAVQYNSTNSRLLSKSVCINCWRYHSGYLLFIVCMTQVRPSRPDLYNEICSLNECPPLSRPLFGNIVWDIVREHNLETLFGNMVWQHSLENFLWI